MFVVNAISSQRVGPDYLLTASNRSSLLLASRNLQLACSWLPSSNSDLDPAFTLDALEIEVSTPEKLKVLSEADRESVVEAERWLRIAMNDPHWRAILPKISIPIRMGRLPAEILRETSLTESFDPDVCLSTAEIPLSLRTAAASITDANAITGQLIKAAQAAKKHQPFLEPPTAKAKKRKKNAELSVAAESKHRSAAQTLRRSGLAATHDRLQDAEVIDLSDGNEQPAPSARKRKRAPSDVPATNAPRARRPAPPIPPEVRAMELSFSTVSSKLDWVVAEILKNDDDRFLVFAKDSVMLGQLTEVSTGV